MKKILTKSSLPKWLDKLKSYQIYAPVMEDQHWSYKIVNNSESIDLEYLNAIQSPKKALFPQREILFEFKSDKGNSPSVKETLPEIQDTVFFGVRPCDAMGVSHMDKVFCSDFEDHYYSKRRNKTTLVGLACNTPPFLNCFCLSVNGSPHSTDGLDLLMTEEADHYFVESFTKKGDSLIKLGLNYFKDLSADEIKKLKNMHSDSEKKLKRTIDNVNSIPEKLKNMFDSPIWEEESKSCIKCGICTYLCPTCHCFDINDEVTSSAPLSGKRVRTWDNCQFPDFTMHSSGHNPRPDQASRLRQRIMHKFQYFVMKYNSYQCTGCGRCIAKCPVGIDIIDVLEKARDYET